MATVVEIIDKLTEWAKREVCAQVKLKAPPNDICDSNSYGYEYNLVTPTCFSMFIPSEGNLPPDIKTPIPSLCVRIVDGKDDLIKSSSSMTFEFCLCTWNTGTHGKDVFKQRKDAPYIYERWEGEEAEEYFKRDNDVWRDAWNWVDIALRAIESSATIDGLELDRSIPVKFGVFTEEENTPEFFPFYFTWIRFGIKRPLVRNIEKYNDLL